MWGLLDICRNSDSESITLFTWNPVPADYNFLLAGNLENGDPSIDYNGDETGDYATTSMKGEDNDDGTLFICQDEDILVVVNKEAA